MTREGGATLIRGVFSDRSSAKRAFDRLLGDDASDTSVDVTFSGSGIAYIVVVSTRTESDGERAEQTLRDLGARVLPALTADKGNRRVHRSISFVLAKEVESAEAEALARWRRATTTLIKEGVAEPADLVAAVVAMQSPATPTEPSEDRTARLRAADAELREVSERLEAELRASQPALFDRAGRLKVATLTERLIEKTGGKRVLSGDNLTALEEAADAEATQPPRRAT